MHREHVRQVVSEAEHPVSMFSRLMTRLRRFLSFSLARSASLLNDLLVLQNNCFAYVLQFRTINISGTSLLVDEHGNKILSGLEYAPLQ